MPTIINSIEQLMQFLNDKGVLEIAQRRKDQKFKKFQNVIIDPSLLNRAQEQIQNEIKKALNINNDLIKSSLSNVAESGARITSQQLQASRTISPSVAG